MWIALIILIVWVVGYAIMACVAGVFCSKNEDSIETIMVLLLLWPIVAIIIAITFIIRLPFEIGKAVGGKR